MARPTKLTPALQKTFLRAFARTRYVETAADLAGIHRTTVRRWIKAGRRKPNSAEAGFCIAVKKAMADQEAAGLTAIAGHGDTAWQAHAWLLERRHPGRWGDQKKLIRDIQTRLKKMEQARADTGDAAGPAG